MIKFTHKSTYSNAGKVKINLLRRSGLISLLPTNVVAQRLVTFILLVISLILLSFFVISLSGKHLSWHNIVHRLANLVPSIQRKQNVNTTAPLVNLPGGQFLPSLSYPLNILVMGVDSNGKNTQRFVATRSDTMMLVSINPQKNQAAIISIPRDSRVPIADSHREDKINSAHAFGGPQLALETVKQAFNIPVDRYLVVDEEGFKNLIQEVGPIDVLIEKKMTYYDHSAALSINLEPGLKKLDAKQAEGYIRFRHDAKGDIGRIERQQWFARQITSKFADPQVLVKLPKLIKIASDCIVTDLTVDEMIRLVGFACHTNPSKIQMAVLPGKADMIHGVSYWLPDREATTAVLNKLAITDSRMPKEPGGNQTSDQEPMADLGSAMAYTSNSSSTQSPAPQADQQFTVSIRYPPGCAKEADSLELLLNQAGFISKGKYKADLADCQHEQIIENSVHGLALSPESLHNQLSCLAQWPVMISVDSQANSDLTLVITPNSKFVTLTNTDSPSSSK